MCGNKLKGQFLFAVLLDRRGSRSGSAGAGGRFLSYYHIRIAVDFGSSSRPYSISFDGSTRISELSKGKNGFIIFVSCPLYFPPVLQLYAADCGTMLTPCRLVDLFASKNSKIWVPIPGGLPCSISAELGLRSLLEFHDNMKKKQETGKQKESDCG